MKPFSVLPFPDAGLLSWMISGVQPARQASLAAFFAGPVAGAFGVPPGRTTTATAVLQPPPRLVGPGEQPENQQAEDVDDLELESDEDPSKLRSARPRPGADESSTAARGGNGAVSPPLP